MDDQVKPVEAGPPADDARRLRLYVYGIVFSRVILPDKVESRGSIGFFQEFGNDATAMERTRGIAADLTRGNDANNEPALVVKEITAEYLREHMKMLELAESLEAT